MSMDFNVEVSDHVFNPLVEKMHNSPKYEKLRQEAEQSGQIKYMVYKAILDPKLLPDEYFEGGAPKEAYTEDVLYTSFDQRDVERFISDFKDSEYLPEEVRMSMTTKEELIGDWLSEEGMQLVETVLKGHLQKKIKEKVLADNPELFDMLHASEHEDAERYANIVNESSGFDTEFD